MVILKRITYLLAMLILMASFSQCSTAQKLKKKPPVPLVESYFQQWTAGIQGGGSGINLFLKTSLWTHDHQKLDSVYFRGQSVKLKIIEDNQGLTYLGRFQTDFNQPKQDVVLSNDPNEEYKNQLPQKPYKIPFDLKDDECVVTYKKGDKILYYKISNIIQKDPLNYPSAPPNRQ